MAWPGKTGVLCLGDFVGLGHWSWLTPASSLGSGLMFLLRDGLGRNTSDSETDLRSFSVVASFFDIHFLLCSTTLVKSIALLAEKASFPSPISALLW